MSPCERRYVIVFGCPDRTGIIARISSLLADLGGWIVDAAYHTDRVHNWFFTRQEVLADSLSVGLDELRERLGRLALELGSHPARPSGPIGPIGARVRNARSIG